MASIAQRPTPDANPHHNRPSHPICDVLADLLEQGAGDDLSSTAKSLLMRQVAAHLRSLDLNAWNSYNVADLTSALSRSHKAVYDGLTTLRKHGFIEETLGAERGTRRGRVTPRPINN